MTDIPDHVRAAMQRIKSCPRVKNIWDLTTDDWRNSLYFSPNLGGRVMGNYQDDLRTVANWCIDQQREFDT